ncbi:IS1/IS1595 family N-terminal zinc-binding domain-containing protein [Microbacterium paludicola]
MDLPSNTTTCLVCGSRLVKNGRHRSGTQRWRCKDCGSSTIRRRSDVTRREAAAPVPDLADGEEHSGPSRRRHRTLLP